MSRPLRPAGAEILCSDTNPVKATHYDGRYHSFNITTAERYGIDGAIVIYFFQLWIEKNVADHRNFRDGRWWSYNSYPGLAQLIPYYNERQLRRIIDKLVGEGVLIRRQHSTDHGDFRNWYAFEDQSAFILPSILFEGVTRAADIATKQGYAENGRGMPKTAGGMPKTADIHVSTKLVPNQDAVEGDAPPTTPTATASPYEDYDPREPRRPKPSSSEPPPKAESAGKAKIPATEGQRLVDACNREAFQYLCQPWYGDHKAQLARQVDDTLAAGIRVTVEDIRAAMLLASKTYREARANGTSASSTPPPYLIGKSLTLIVADRGAELLDDAVVPHVQQRQRPKNIITGAEGNLLRREDFEDRSQWEIDV